MLFSITLFFCEHVLLRTGVVYLVTHAVKLSAEMHKVYHCYNDSMSRAVQNFPNGDRQIAKSVFILVYYFATRIRRIFYAVASLHIHTV